MFFGYQSGTTLTVTAMVSGTIQRPASNSWILRGMGVAYLTLFATSGGTGTGGTGTYTGMTVSQTVGSSGSPVLMYQSTPYWLRTCVQLAMPPTNPVATGSASGGTLSGSAYYYRVTAVCGAQGESGGCTEVSATGLTGSSNSVALTWTVDTRSVPPTSFNIYRSTATGTEFFLCNVGLPPVNGAGQYAWTDIGSIAYGVSAQVTITGGSGLSQLAITAVAFGEVLVGQYIIGSGATTGSTKISSYNTSGGSGGSVNISASITTTTGTYYLANPVPANQTFPLSQVVNSNGEGMNYISAGGNYGNGTSQLATTGTTWMASTFADAYGATELAGTPIMLNKTPVVGIIGDSIDAGQTSAGSNSVGHGPSAQALAALNIPYRLMAISGDYVYNQVVPAYFRNRAQMLQGCTHVIIETTTNDIYTGQSTAQVEGNLLTLATQAWAGGAKVYLTTTTPRVTTTDSGVTITNQTQNGSDEPTRQAVNNWKRGGCPMTISADWRDDAGHSRHLGRDHDGAGRAPGVRHDRLLRPGRGEQQQHADSERRLLRRLADRQHAARHRVLG